MSRATNQQIAAGFSQGLQNFVQGYTQNQQLRKQREIEERNAAIINDPNATPMQRAIAASKISPQLLKEVSRQNQTQNLVSQLQQFYPELGGVQGPSRMAENAIAQGFPQQQEQFPIEQPVGATSSAIPQMHQKESPKLPMGARIAIAAENPAVARTIDAIEREKQKERLETRKEEREIRKETQPYVEQILDTQKAIRTDNSILNDMEALSRTGKLTTPLTATLLNKIGLPLGVLNNPESEEFDKLSNQLTRTIQNYYGARILQSEFHNFLRQIPTLQNSEEGRKRIIDNLRKANVPNQLEYEAYKEVMRENGGKRPPDLKERVTEKLLPSLDQWLKDMKESLSKTMPSQVPEGTLVIVAPDGRRVAVPKDKIGEALSQGGKLE